MKRSDHHTKTTKETVAGLVALDSDDHITPTMIEIDTFGTHSDIYGASPQIESHVKNSAMCCEDDSNHDESLLAEMAMLEQELTADQTQVESSSLLDSRDNDDLMLEMEEFMS